MATATKNDIYTANTSFVADIDEGDKDEDGNPVPRRYAAKTGQKFAGNHPLVKLAPGYFDGEDASQRVEQATAAPGEVRGA